MSQFHRLVSPGHKPVASTQSVVLLRPATPAFWLFARNLAFALCFLCLLLMPNRARAANFSVTTLSDNPADAGSLRAAIAKVQTSTDAKDTISISAMGTITLTNGELALSNPGNVAGKTVTINGPGAGALFVSGPKVDSNGAGGSRVFHFSNLAVNLNDIAVINGFVNSGTQSAGGVALGGAGILAEGGSLTMNGVVVEDCFVNLQGAFGGGIAGGNAALTLTNCVITSDHVSAFNGGGGGGIGSILGSLTMTDCTVNFNGESGFGGGIGSLNEPLTLTRCTVVGNQILNTNRGNAYGGGVYSQSGTVTLSDCTISGNSASNGGSGLYLKFGSAALNGCTLDRNNTEGDLTRGLQSDGGGLNIAGAGVSVTNCTFTGNGADFGGAIYNQGGALTLSNSTVARNGGSNFSGTTGAGLFVASGASATVTSTILTGNTTFNGESDVVNQGTLTSGGSNLLGDANGNGFTGGVNHDQTGVNQAQAGIAFTLADNGGPTQTLALKATSSAIDADYADATATDQRGATRPVGARNDSGAFEFGATATPNVSDSFIVTNTNDDGLGSLRRALNNVNANPSAKISFDPKVFGPGMPRTIKLTSGPLVVRQSVALNGPGQNLLTISGNNASRVFNINVSSVQISPNSSTANISGLTVEGGAALLGGGIFVNGGALNLTDCTVSGNTASGQGGAGGGIENFGNTTLTRCTISGNTAPNGLGGGIDSYISATLTMTDCTVAGNSAAQGGGLSGLAGVAFLNNCTLSGNSATQGGGAYASSGLFFFNCTVSGNTATSGGGLYSARNGGIFLFSSTVSANIATTGSGLYTDNGGTSSVSTTILAGNKNGANIVNNSGTITSGGSNLIGNGNGFTNDPNHANPNSTGNHDQTGVTNPGLAPLQNNGGPTQTMALLPGSPAIDADFSGNAAPDQRGVARPIGVRNDIGAFEGDGTGIIPGFGVSLTPAGPTTNQTLTATPVFATPPSGLTFSYNFSVNGKSVQNGASNKLDLSKPGQGDKGQTVSVVLTATSTTSSATATNSVKVVNSAPVTSNVSGTAGEGQTVSIPVSATDADGDALTFKSVGGPVNGVGGFVTSNGKTNFVYTSRARFNETETIRFVALDDTGKPSNIATISIAVRAAPRTIGLGVSLTPYGPKTNDTLTATPVITDAKGITFSYAWSVNGVLRPNETTNKLDLSKPGNGDRGETVSVTVTAKRGIDSGTATNSTVIVNSAPVANDASASGTSGAEISVPLTGNDADGDPLTFKSVGGPANGTGSFVTSNGKTSFVYRSRNGFISTETIRFVAADELGRTSVPATITINVTASASSALLSSGGASSGNS